MCAGQPPPGATCDAADRAHSMTGAGGPAERRWPDDIRIGISLDPLRCLGVEIVPAATEVVIS